MVSACTNWCGREEGPVGVAVPRDLNISVQVLIKETLTTTLFSISGVFIKKISWFLQRYRYNDDFKLLEFWWR